MIEPFVKWWRSGNGILLFIAILFVLAHFVTNGQYGFHRDELQTLDDARHLDWGFVAYPPLTPAVGRLELALFGISLFGIRVIPTLALGLAVFTTGVIARELGGGRKAQILAALTVAIVPIVSIETNLLQYVSFDYLWGVLLTYFAIRLLNTNDPRWWFLIGVVIGLGMMTKYTMGFFVCGFAAGVLLTRARQQLFNRWLLLGVALSLLIFLPNLIWQMQHDFISLDYLRHIHARDVRIGRTRNFIPEQLVVCVNTLTLPLALMGLWFYFTKNARKYRLLGWMYLTTFALFLIAQARSYYLAPLYPSLFAAGAVVWERWLAASSRRASLAIQTATWTFIMVGTIFVFAVFTPVAPINSALWRAAAALHDNYVEEIGWTDLVENVARVYNSIPSEERDQTGILVGNYGEAGAINLLGRGYGLPSAISGTNTNWYRAYPHSEPQTLIVVGFDSDDVKELFESCELVGHNTNAHGIRNEESRDWPDIFLCRRLRTSWPEFWRRFRRYG